MLTRVISNVDTTRYYMNISRQIKAMKIIISQRRYCN